MSGFAAGFLVGIATAIVFTIVWVELNTRSNKK